MTPRHRVSPCVHFPLDSWLLVSRVEAHGLVDAREGAQLSRGLCLTSCLVGPAAILVGPVAILGGRCQTPGVQRHHPPPQLPTHPPSLAPAL